MQLGPAIAVLIQSVGPLNYSHVGGDVVEVSSQSRGRNLIEDLIYQHLDAYLQDAAFKDPQWNAQSIFIGE